jgi:hypothetical protein
MNRHRNYYQRVGDLVDRTSTSLPEPHRGGAASGHGRKIRRIFAVAAVSLCLFLAMVYAADYLVVRYRVAKKRNAFGVVQVDRYYAIHKKGGKIEFNYDGTETQTCVHSVFPHLGYSPCWYAAGRTEKRIEM